MQEACTFLQERLLLCNGTPVKFVSSTQDSHYQYRFLFTLLSQPRVKVKKIAAEWRNMDPNEKADWQEQGRKDKIRYEQEMEEYRESLVRMGLQQPGSEQPPRRPSSAYLSFSNERRREFKKKFPLATNSELSGLLSKAWKEAPPEIVKKYRDEEKRQRDWYHEAIRPWKNNPGSTSKKQKRAKISASSTEDQKPAAVSAISHPQHALDNRIAANAPDVQTSSAATVSTPLNQQTSNLHLAVEEQKADMPFTECYPNSIQALVRQGLTTNNSGLAQLYQQRQDQLVLLRAQQEREQIIQQLEIQLHQEQIQQRSFLLQMQMQQQSLLQRQSDLEHLLTREQLQVAREQQRVAMLQGLDEVRRDPTNETLAERLRRLRGLI